LSSLSSSLPLTYLHSFPTRRSSDLHSLLERPLPQQAGGGMRLPQSLDDAREIEARAVAVDERLIEFLRARAHRHVRADAHRRFRSEEHTSELQSRRELVCRLLLEKK